MKKYVVNDPEDGFIYYDNLQEAINALNDLIHDGRFDEGWPPDEEMKGYFVAEITHVATQKNFRERPPKEELADSPVIMNWKG